MATHPIDDESNRTAQDNAAAVENESEADEINPEEFESHAPNAPVQSDEQSISLMVEVDLLLSHVWMVRTFLKHSDEASDDEELAEVHRVLYDYMLALGPSLDSGDAKRYLKLARKKLGKLKSATDLFLEIQPEVSGHMNFRMAAKSLRLAVDQINKLLYV